MGFTPIAIEGRFTNADGSPASGTICLEPDSELINGEETQSRQPICGLLDADGRIIGQDQRALVVNATDDAGTTPVGSSYTVTLQLDGQSVVGFSTPMPSNPASWGGVRPVTCTDPIASGSTASALISLVDLVAAEAMVGATLSGLNTGTVVSVDETANTIMASGDSAFTGVHTLTIEGGCVEFAALEANAL
jgi:hypothetical protein